MSKPLDRALLDPTFEYERSLAVDFGLAVQDDTLSEMSADRSLTALQSIAQFFKDRRDHRTHRKINAVYAILGEGVSSADLLYAAENPKKLTELLNEASRKTEQITGNLPDDLKEHDKWTVEQVEDLEKRFKQGKA